MKDCNQSINSINTVLGKTIVNQEQFLITSEIENLIKSFSAEFFQCLESLKIITNNYCNTDKDLINQQSFNIFRLISDFYYRENFHSDILASILDFTDTNNKKILLEDFIQFLKSAPHSNLNLDSFIYDYSTYKIFREKGRIDISILNETKMKAIIIENKINNAQDMHRQIPRYVEWLQEKKYEVVAIVYLVLKNGKAPETYTWVEADFENIMPKILSIRAVNSNEYSLVNGWLSNCLQKLPETSDIYFLIKHYLDLLTHLSGKIMNNKLMEQFLQHCLTGNNYANSLSVKDMLNDLIFYRRDKIIEEFSHKKYPFTRVTEWDNIAVIDTLKLNESNFAIDIVVEQSIYQFQFFDRNYNGSITENKINPASLMLEKMCINDFIPEALRMQKTFKFPEQEKELYDYTNFFINKVKESISSI